MNASEDETEPMGESPAIDTLDAIEHFGALGLLSECDKVLATRQLAERQTQALNKVRELHPRKIRPFPGDVFEAICVGCGNLWPCSTIRAIDEAGA
ncbi:hypothetical protein [Mycolicibacterium conceptionense]|uniref:hypothetical protein n=1 Tax=Mycolicibacterium conceptionense TaxID=451644 RepID=UPI00096DB67D|nr:hypothetical protein [Mycolicibacterium conceptionense]OMB79242.1 hypothetical protein A5743_14145 [Mycolicibacterium conceptionense]